MSYENDGCLGYILTVTYDTGTTVPARSTIYSDREQTQSLANCLTAKAAANSTGARYGVAGIKPMPAVAISGDYSGPYHDLSDDCEPAPYDR